MNELAPTGQANPTSEQLQSIHRLYEQGLYIQAYELSKEIGPLDTWRGADARIMAGRLAGNLGGIRLGDWHFLKAWRQNPSSAEAHWFYARTLLALRGPWAAWQFVQKHPLPANASPKSQSHWLSLIHI